MSEQSSGGRGPEFLSTQPSHGTRMKNLASPAWMGPAMKLYEEAGSKAPFRKLPPV